MAHASDILQDRVGAADLLTSRVTEFKDRFSKWSLYRQTVRELQSLSDRELSDLGLGRSSIRFVARMATYGK